MVIVILLVSEAARYTFTGISRFWVGNLAMSQHEELVSILSDAGKAGRVLIYFIIQRHMLNQNLKNHSPDYTILKDTRNLKYS